MGCDLPDCRCSARCLRAYCPPYHLQDFDAVLSQAGTPRQGSPLRVADISVSEARQAHALGVLDAVLTVAALNARCERCGHVPDSIECRAVHELEQPEPAPDRPRQPWEPRPARSARPAAAAA